MREAAPARPRLIATDLDGTLLRSDGTLSDRTRAAIIAAEDAGIVPVFVTARPPRRLDGLADAVGSHGIALCGNGAFVYEVGTRTVIEQYPIADDLFDQLIADLRTAVPDIVFAVERADGFGREESFIDRREKPERLTVDEGTALATSPVGKLLARSEGSDPDEFLARVVEALDGRAELGYSGAIGLAEITGPGVTKAAGLARWCAGHGIDASEVWAFGDMPNDLPMLEWAGTSFAVGNAHDDVRAMADRITASNDEDGVAQAIEDLLGR